MERIVSVRLRKPQLVSPLRNKQKMSSKEKERTLFTSSSIAAAAFNLPVMVIAGVIIGYLLSTNLEPPLREVVLIGTILIFFVIAVIELYYVANKQQFRQFHPKSPSRDLIKLIREYNDEEE